MESNQYAMVNDKVVEYFPLEEYINRIKLLPHVLEHLDDTNNAFKDYINKIGAYDEKYIIDYWVYLLYEELRFNQQIEHPVDYSQIDLQNDEVFFDTLSISNRRIHNLHNFAVKNEYDPTFEYRKSEVQVSRLVEGKEQIIYRGAQAADLEKFMNDFIKIYKRNDVSLLMSNPFLKSALIHLLFLRIHPYADGNGRTARLLHNSKFTASINSIYGTKLRISPLNLSGSILLNKISYIKAIDNIYFDLEHDTNEAINNWFDFILNMANEHIYYSSSKLDYIDSSFLKADADEDHVIDMNRKMKVRSLTNKNR